jgi:hypothetical protein
MWGSMSFFIRSLEYEPGQGWSFISTADDGEERVPGDSIEVEEEPVNQQSHYTRFEIQPLHFCKVNNLGYLEGNVIKYVCRYPYKGTPLRDLQKARDYIDHLIDRLEAEMD